MDPEASVIIPVHNEAEVIKGNAEKLRGFLAEELNGHEIILCENGSSDDTLKIAEELAEQFEDVRVLALPEPNLAEALKEGFEVARSDKVVYFPMDLSVNLDFIPTSVGLLDKFDVVVGSKRLGSNTDRRPMSRRVPSKAYHGMVRRLFGVELTDTTCVKAYRRGKILNIIGKVPTSSRIFETELLVEAVKEGLDVVEIPVSVEERRRSREKLGRKIQGKLEDLLSARLDLVAIYVGAPIFLFGVAGLFYLTLDKLLFASQSGFSNPYSFLLSMLLVISGFQIVTFGLLANLILQIRRELRRAKSDETKS
jgi:glycosyltransferase involved in cell wall biosynthesis